MLGGEIDESNGFNCVLPAGSCLTRKLGVMPRQPRRPPALREPRPADRPEAGAGPQARRRCRARPGQTSGCAAIALRRADAVAVAPERAGDMTALPRYGRSAAPSRAAASSGRGSDRGPRSARPAPHRHRRRPPRSKASSRAAGRRRRGRRARARSSRGRGRAGRRCPRRRTSRGRRTGTASTRPQWRRSDRRRRRSRRGASRIRRAGRGSASETGDEPDTAAREIEPVLAGSMSPCVKKSKSGDSICRSQPPVIGRSSAM